MGGFFGMDGPFDKIGGLIADILLLSLCWILFSLPLFTAGASTTALYYVMTRRISDREGYIFRDFWSSFKSNFKQSTLIWLLLILAGGIILVNIRNIDLTGRLKIFLLPVQICCLIEICLISLYIFPINARFDIKLFESVKSSFVLANRHIVTSIVCMAAALAAGFAVSLYFPFILAAMGVYAYVTSSLLMQVFKKYRPEIDKDAQS
ncbi:MAG: YesL family protein [Clostridiales bacterium]|nr:YesL family protein [Clostridiales bacterium]